MADFDARIRDLLRDHELPQDEWAVERIRGDVEIALSAAKETAVAALRKGEAEALLNAAKTVLRMSARHHLATPEELASVRVLAIQAQVRLLPTPVRGGADQVSKPDRNAWLGICAVNFHDAWRELTSKDAGMYFDYRASPALAFVTACAQLVTENVNVHTVLRHFQRSIAHTAAEEMNDEEYASFLRSRTYRILAGRDL